MTKPAITTRATKGSALTWTEGDTNLENLQNATVTLKAGTGGTDVVSDLNGTVTLVAGTNVSLSGDNTAKTVTINSTATGGATTLDELSDVSTAGAGNEQLLSYNSTTSSWQPRTVSAGISAVVSDTAPLLGGDLNVNGKNIISTSGTAITVAPGNISNNINLKSNSVYVGNPDATSGTASVFVAGSQSLSLASNASITIGYQTNANISLDPAGTGKVILSGMSFPLNDGTTGQVLSTDGAGLLGWTTVSGGSSTLDGLSDVVITAAATNDILRFDGTNWVDTAASTLTVSAASTATTATGATNINISTTTGNTNDATLYPVMVGASSTGNQLPHIDTSGLAFNALTNALTLGSGSSTTGASIVLFDGSAGAGGSVTLSAGANTGGDRTITFPTTNGSNNNLLGTSGGGQLTWVSAVNNVSIGATTRSTGAFTTLTADTTTLDDIRETVSTLTYAATITPNCANGSIQKVTLTGNVTFSAFASPVAGQSLTLIITQDATGSRTLTSTMKFSGGSKTLSTAANSIDILSVFYDGTNYYASLGKGFA